MLIDAPNGWGLGSSGEAYMQWYQPLLLGEQYRTMVSSHITYFLEFQFFFKFAYIFLWTFVFYASFPRAKNIKSSLCFSFFVMFFISGIFSSVYEEFILLIPFICVAVLVVYRNAFIFSKRHITCIFLLSAFLFLGVYAISYALYSQSHIHYSDKTVKIGNGTFNITIFYDKKVFGKYYGKKIRNYIASHSNCSIYVLPLEHFSKIAQESNFLMISSYDEYLKFVSKDTQIVFINPELNIDKISTFTNSRILCGEFSSSLLLVDAYTVKYEILKGMGNYIPNWTDFLPSIILISDE
jgi:hypothetical protein